MLPLKLLDGVSLVGGGVVQQHDQRAAQVAQQFAQEAADLLLADVVEEKQIIETQSTPPRAEGNAGDDTDLVSPSLAVTMNGCLPLRRPGPHHVGDEQKVYRSLCAACQLRREIWLSDQMCVMVHMGDRDQARASRFHGMLLSAGNGDRSMEDMTDRDGRENTNDGRVAIYD
ncbi:MAG: hypothetical protein WAL73_05740, partial [Terracidiphilus sp.]